MKTKKIEVPIELFNKLKVIANNIILPEKQQKNEMFQVLDTNHGLYGVFSDDDILAPVSDELASKKVPYGDKEIGVLSRPSLKAIFITRKAAEEHLESNKNFYDNGEIKLLNTSLGHANKELSFISGALIYLFGNKK